MSSAVVHPHKPPDDENRALQLLAVLYVLLAVVMLSTGARFYSRHKYVGALRPEDWIVLLAAVCFPASLFQTSEEREGGMCSLLVPFFAFVRV